MSEHYITLDTTEPDGAWRCSCGAEADGFEHWEARLSAAQHLLDPEGEETVDDDGWRTDVRNRADQAARRNPEQWVWYTTSGTVPMDSLTNPVLGELTRGDLVEQLARGQQLAVPYANHSEHRQEWLP